MLLAEKRLVAVAVETVSLTEFNWSFLILIEEYSYDFKASVNIHVNNNMASKSAKGGKNSQVQNSVAERRLRPIYGEKFLKM